MDGSGTHHATIGMDVSDRKTQVCVMSKAGGSPKVVMETTIPTTREGLRRFLAAQDRGAAVVFETGTHCRWMEEEAREAGFRAYVANPCRLRMITESGTKNDRNDARELARLALADAELLHPVRLRGERCQQALRLLKARDMLVKVRTMHVNELKGERMCARGGRIAKRKALVAVARYLVVTAVALLKRPDAKYVPLSEAARREFEAMRASAA